MSDKMREIRGGMAPDQESLILAQKQRAQGLYPDGNPLLDQADREANQAYEEYGVPQPPIPTEPVTPTPTRKATSTPTVTPTPTRMATPTPTVQTMPSPTFMKGELPRPTTTPYPQPTPIPGAGSIYQTPETDTFLSKVIIPMAKRYNIHPAIAAGQYAGEGRLGGEGAKLNNFFNIANSDSAVERGEFQGYATPEAGVEQYMQFISGMLPSSAYGNGESGAREGKWGRKEYEDAMNKYRNNPEAFINAAGPQYASRPDYSSFVRSTPEYRHYK